MLMVVKLQRAQFPGLTPVEWRCQIPPAVCSSSTPMAHAGAADQAEHSSMEPMDSAIGDAVADAAATAAAAALVALPQPAAAAAGELTACSQ